MSNYRTSISSRGGSAKCRHRPKPTYPQWRAGGTGLAPEPFAEDGRPAIHAAHYLPETGHEDPAKLPPLASLDRAETSFGPIAQA